jgi:Fe2+ or Zn2+ uptake regulation protein
MKALIERLLAAGIQPTPQRIAIARHVLDSRTHPTAEDVLKVVRRRHPTVNAGPRPGGATP